MLDLGNQIGEALGRRKVLIIDDAYNAVPGLRDIGDDAVTNCREELEDEKALADFQGLVTRKVEVERLSDLLEDEEALEQLWSARNTENHAKKALGVLFASAGKALEDRRRPILPLETLIKDSLKLELVTLGSNAIEGDGELSQHASDSRLFFVDYYLDPNGKDEQAVDICVKKIAAIYARYPVGERPIVVLMSSEELTKDQQQRFRRNLSALGSHFTFIHKPKLSNAIEVQLKLDGLRQTYKHACAIDKALDTWEKGARKSLEGCVQDLRALDISDYAFLDKFRLDEERAHLGHYVLWLYGEYLNSVIENQPEIISTADELDKMSIDTLFPPSLLPDDELVKIYSGAVFTNFRPKPPRERKDDDAHKYRVMLGDLYYVRYPDQETKVDEAYVVITPACNLARAKGTTRVTMLRGVLRPKTEALDSTMVPEFVVIGGKTYAASWEFDAAPVKTVSEIQDEIDKGTWKRLTRLRPLYALYLQRRHASDLLNVGMPVATQWYYPISAEVLGRGAGNAATPLMTCEDSESLVWRVTGGGEPVVVLLERFVMRLHDVLARSENEKEKALAEKFDDFAALRTPLIVKGKDTKVGSFSVTFLPKHTPAEKNSSSSSVWIRVFPGALAPTVEVAKEIAASIPPETVIATSLPEQPATIEAKPLAGQVLTKKPEGENP